MSAHKMPTRRAAAALGALVALTATLGACTGTADDAESAAERPGVTAPGDDVAPDKPGDDGAGDDAGVDDGGPEDGAADDGAVEDDVVDDFTGYPVIVNGQGLAVDFVSVGEDEIFPTHVPLWPVAEQLGAGVWYEPGSAEVAVDGRDGRIEFTLDSAVFAVDGETVELAHPAVLIDGEIYVPIPFFREVFGLETAFFQHGHVILSDTPGDMG